MKKFHLHLASALLMVLVLGVSSCNDDPTVVPDAPTVTAPASVTNVSFAAASDITFNVVTPGGYQSSAVTATAGTAALKSEPAAGSESGSVVVTFTAGSTAGAGSVVLTTTDSNTKTATGTAVIAVAAKAIIEITSAITASTTWKATEKYLLKGNVYVRSGVELTIEPGTVIFGDKITKGALIINRGAKIHAVGTPAKPIIFTSSAPKGFRNYGDWGGVVILGKAGNNQSGSQNIEGITATGTEDGVYGNSGTSSAAGVPTDATTDADNSGELQYARIEFAGIALSTDNELNGLTMGSVGSGTKIDHIQVSFSGDDSYEWFGGTVNTAYLIAYRGWDDEFDTDFGYRGFNQFLVSFRDPNIADKSGSNGFESDNNAQIDNKTPQTAATFANVTFFGPFMYAALSSAGALQTSTVSANYGRAAHIRRNSALKVYNTVFAGANLNGINFEATSSSAVFKGNYLARITGYNKLTTRVGEITAYDDANFLTENSIAATLTAVDVSAVFAGGSINSGGLTNVLWDINAPKALLASNSALLTGAVALPAFPTNSNFNTGVTYRGAFDATNNWASSTWTNYDPNNTEY